MEFYEKGNVSTCGPDTDQLIADAKQLRSEVLKDLYSDFVKWFKALVSQKDSGPIASLEKFHRSALDKACCN